MAGFIKLIRGRTLQDLLKLPNHLALMVTIAERTKVSNEGINEYKLNIGEALIGDYDFYKNISRQNYRTIKKDLEDWGLIKIIKVTTKGTVVSLVNTRVFDLNIETSQPSSNHQVTIKPTIKQPSEITTEEDLEATINQPSKSLYNIREDVIFKKTSNHQVTIKDNHHKKTKVTTKVTTNKEVKKKEEEKNIKKRKVDSLEDKKLPTLEEQFHKLWNAYPSDRRTTKAKATKSWLVQTKRNKIHKPNNFKSLLEKLEQLKSTTWAKQANGWQQSPPFLTTWLNNEGWTEEIGQGEQQQTSTLSIKMTPELQKKQDEKIKSQLKGDIMRTWKEADKNGDYVIENALTLQPFQVASRLPTKDLDKYFSKEKQELQIKNWNVEAIKKLYQSFRFNMSNNEPKTPLTSIVTKKISNDTQNKITTPSSPSEGDCNNINYAAMYN